MPSLGVPDGGFRTQSRQAFLNWLFDNQNSLFWPGMGNTFFVDPASGSDNSDGTTPATAKATLSAAYNLTTSGNNDVVVLIGDGTTAATARVDSAFTWSNNATHLFGTCSPVLFSQRARIAPTSTTTAFTPFFTISGNGCIFQNIQWFHGFGTGTTNQICMVVTGSRNYFQNCHIAGMGDTASAQSAGSRSLKIGGSGAGENVFDSCVLGLDTVVSTQANATIEFTGGAVRNVWRNCIFPRAGASGTLYVIGSAASCLDRYNYFDQCTFSEFNTKITAIATLAASAGGTLSFKDCSLLNITGFGSDATTRAQILIEGGTPAAATTGLAVAPTA